MGDAILQYDDSRRPARSAVGLASVIVGVFGMALGLALPRLLDLTATVVTDPDTGRRSDQISATNVVLDLLTLGGPLVGLITVGVALYLSPRRRLALVGLLLNAVSAAIAYRRFVGW